MKKKKQKTLKPKLDIFWSPKFPEALSGEQCHGLLEG